MSNLNEKWGIWGKFVNGKECWLWAIPPKKTNQKEFWGLTPFFNTKKEAGILAERWEDDPQVVEFKIEKVMLPKG